MEIKLRFVGIISMGDYFGKKMDCDIDLNLPLKEVKFKWYPENYSRQNNTTTPLVSQNGTQVSIHLLIHVAS